MDVSAACAQVLSDAAKSLWRRYSAKAKELKQSVHTVSVMLELRSCISRCTWRVC